jgi:hypothetical protein
MTGMSRYNARLAQWLDIAGRLGNRGYNWGFCRQVWNDKSQAQRLPVFLYERWSSRVVARAKKHRAGYYQVTSALRLCLYEHVSCTIRYRSRVILILGDLLLARRRRGLQISKRIVRFGTSVDKTQRGPWLCFLVHGIPESRYRLSRRSTSRPHSRTGESDRPENWGFPPQWSPSLPACEKNRWGRGEINRRRALLLLAPFLTLYAKHALLGIASRSADESNGRSWLNLMLNDVNAYVDRNPAESMIHSPDLKPLSINWRFSQLRSGIELEFQVRYICIDMSEFQRLKLSTSYAYIMNNIDVSTSVLSRSTAHFLFLLECNVYYRRIKWQIRPRGEIIHRHSWTVFSLEWMQFSRNSSGLLFACVETANLYKTFSIRGATTICEYVVEKPGRGTSATADLIIIIIP